MLPTTSHIPLFLSLVLDFVSSAVCPAVLCQWFLADVIRRTTEAARSIFDYCLSPSSSTTSKKRARSLAQVVKAIGALMSLSSRTRSHLDKLVSRLVLLRLQEGPRPGWECVDGALCGMFDPSIEITSLKQHYDAMLDAVRTETWGEAGKDLRVRKTAFLEILTDLLFKVVVYIHHPQLLTGVRRAQPSHNQRCYTR